MSRIAHYQTRAWPKKTCLTPGAIYVFSTGLANQDVGQLHFKVERIPDETLRRIDEKTAKRLEKAFHDAIEQVLAPVWPKEPTA